MIMKILINFFALLVITFYSCYAQKPEIIIRSGFETNTVITEQNPNHLDNISGKDNTFLRPNDFELDLDNRYDISHAYINYGPQTAGTRKAQLIMDPTDSNNTVIRYRIDQAHTEGNSGTPKGRIQQSIIFEPYRYYELAHTIKLYLPETLNPLKDPHFEIPHDWFNLMEYWANPWNGDNRYKITFDLYKNSTEPTTLRFAVGGVKPVNGGNSPQWEYINTDYEVPLGQWIHLQLYYKQGVDDQQNGRFIVNLIQENGDLINLFDITEQMHNEEEYNPDGLSFFNPMKLYTSAETIYYINGRDGKVEVFWDDFVMCDKLGLDLQIRNSHEDIGIEPDNNTDVFWQSNDIWVRNQDDDIEEHQNPEYDSNNPNYVYVKVNNKSCTPSKSNNSKVKLYWAKANTSLSWPNHWDGSLLVDNIQMGGEIGEVEIPTLLPGEDVNLKFEWNVPNPNDYFEINENPWHFCLLARIISDEDQMSTPEVSSLFANVKNNNNVAWKNLTVVDILPNTLTSNGGVIGIDNFSNQIKDYSLIFKKRDESGKAIYEEAEVTVNMDNIIKENWIIGGSNMSYLKDTKTDNIKLIENNDAKIENIIMSPNSYGTIEINFNFLTKKLSPKQKFYYDVFLIDNDTNEIVGGETFLIKKQNNNSIIADAGKDRQLSNEPFITLSANEVNTNSIYNWYDSDGNLLYVGKDYTYLNNETSSKYKLEVISEDGFKDYDEIEIYANPFEINSITPNPFSDSIIINYNLGACDSAYISFINLTNSDVNNYIIDINSNSISISTNQYGSGLYEIILIADNNIVSRNTIVKE